MLKLVEPGVRSDSPFYYAYGRLPGRAQPIERSLRTADRGEAERRLRELVASLEGELAGACRLAEAEGTLTFAGAIDRYVEARQPHGNTKGYLDRLKADAIARKPVAEVTPGDLQSAANRLQPGCAAATKNRHVIVPGAAVLHHVYEENLRPDWVKVRKLKEGKPHNRRPKAGAIERLLAATEGQRHGFILFLARQGWRVGEACNLRWTHVDLEAETLEAWVSKASTWRTVPMHREVLVMLANLSAARSSSTVDKRRARDPDFVFPWRTRWGVYKWLRPLAAQLGVCVTPHMLRHEFGSAHHEAGADALDLVQMGTWTSTKSTERYCHSDINHARALIKGEPRQRVDTVGKRRESC